MELLPALPICWYCLLVLLVSRHETEAVLSDVCLLDNDDVFLLNSTGLDEVVGITNFKESFACVLYPSDLLNCSWSFLTLEKDTHLSIVMSECKEDTLVDLESKLSVPRVGFWVLNMSQKDHVIVCFNMTKDVEWMVNIRRYEMDLIRPLSPPTNVCASIEGTHLYISWNLPDSNNIANPDCFEYQLDLGEQVGHQNSEELHKSDPTEIEEDLRMLTGTLQYVELNAASSRSYRVRIRTRTSQYCHGYQHWSQWSPTVSLAAEEPWYTLDPLVIVAICLGIPMILLAVLLMVRHQRLTSILFPPIPRPPPQYKYFLEKGDPVCFYPSVPEKHEEEITEVEDAEQNPESNTE
ncbi:interleukin-13 receptor subunit alpha-1 isoform X1 [Nothobranchius furzeri]|uniref:Transcript variant X3 n=1 Tax=Nothobranchius furzeri TaxID=105023 RepID=A0A9D3BWQ5_NOTFU|nr:transcript variant X3 [Nothobranchius furzeri]